MIIYLYVFQFTPDDCKRHCLTGCMSMYGSLPSAHVNCLERRLDMHRLPVYFWAMSDWKWLLFGLSGLLASSQWFACPSTHIRITVHDSIRTKFRICITWTVDINKRTPRLWYFQSDCATLDSISPLRQLKSLLLCQALLSFLFFTLELGHSSCHMYYFNRSRI